ncbi:MAG: DUF58 domain-containing protein, partial [Nocardioides sp.]
MLVLLLGLVPVVLVPRTGTAVLWVALVVVACLLDAGLARRPATLRVQRRESPSARTAPVRLGEETTTEVEISQDGRRAVDLVGRDAWQPTAGAVQTRQRVRVP